MIERTPSPPRLHALTTAELSAALEQTGRGDHPVTLLIPLGATEQHGPHLPLGTDSTVAAHWAERTAAGLVEVGVPTAVAPTLPYGSSGEHQSFAGTLSIGQPALVSVLMELTRSAAGTFERVVFLSGHAGNLEPVVAATVRLVEEGHDVHHFVPAWAPSAKFDVDAHAGRTETSLMLHIDPATVRSELLAPGNTRPLSEILPLLKAGGVAAASTGGVLGDPTMATSQEGADLVESLVAATVAALSG